MNEDPISILAASVDPDQWCILRTAGSRTLPLARSLARAGMDVWTPIEHRVKRIPRSRSRRQSEAPIMPTYVFARARHLPTLATFERRETSEHPPFSLFRYLGEIGLIADVEIDGLREVEDRAKLRFRQPPKPVSDEAYSPNDRVKVPESAWTGLSGEVVESDGRFTLVCFGKRTIKITTSILQPDMVDNRQPTGTAAQAA